MASRADALIGKAVVVNFPNEEGPSYHDGVITGHLDGNRFEIEFQSGVANVNLIPRMRGIDWFIKKGDWNRFKEARLKYYGGSGI